MVFVGWDEARGSMVDWMVGEEGGSHTGTAAAHLHARRAAESETVQVHRSRASAHSARGPVSCLDAWMILSFILTAS
jgi:hypothetical protein